MVFKLLFLKQVELRVSEPIQHPLKVRNLQSAWSMDEEPLT